MAQAPDSILKDDIPIDNLRWALPRRYFFAEEAGVFKGCPLRRGGGEQRSANQGEASPFWILSRSALQDDISSFLFLLYI